MKRPLQTRRRGDTETRGCGELTASPRPCVTLIIGVGNEYRHDDAVGLIVARLLKKLAPDCFTIIEHSGEGVALMEFLAGAETVIVVDAVSSDMPPGSIHQLNAIEQPILREFSKHSSHAFGLAEAIELARVLRQLPANLVIYGIEGKSFETDIGLSHEVAQAAETVVQMIVKEYSSSIGQQREILK